jgi:hypothetical protein
MNTLLLLLLTTTLYVCTRNVYGPLRVLERLQCSADSSKYAKRKNIIVVNGDGNKKLQQAKTKRDDRI